MPAYWESAVVSGCQVKRGSNGDGEHGAQTKWKGKCACASGAAPLHFIPITVNAIVDTNEITTRLQSSVLWLKNSSWVHDTCVSMWWGLWPQHIKGWWNIPFLVVVNKLHFSVGKKKKKGSALPTVLPVVLKKMGHKDSCGSGIFTVKA